jgi:hypothetical protein
MVKQTFVFFVVMAGARTGHAGIGDALSERIADGVVDKVGLHVDVGVEAAMLATGGEHGVGGAVGVDLVVAMFDDHRRAPKPRLRDRLFDHALARLDRKLGGGGREPEPPPVMWPALSRTRLEAHVGGVFDVEGGRRQLHLSAGTGIGGVAIGAAGALEWNDRGRAWAVGPELRLRHRYGPRERSPSVGVVVRYDIFVQDRTTHDDTLSLGVFGMLDVF